MNEIPVDIILFITKYLIPKSLILLMETCKNLLAICQRNDFKQMLISRLEYEGYIIPIKINDIICCAKYYLPKRITCIRKRKLFVVTKLLVYGIELDGRGGFTEYGQQNNIDTFQLVSYANSDIDIHLVSNGTAKMLPYQEVLCHNIINILDYGQQVLFTDNKGRNFMINNNKLTELKIMKNIIQKEQNLYLNKDGTISLENKDYNIELNNVIQLTSNRHALTLDGSVYKITRGGNAVKANIAVNNIKQIESLGLYSGIIILTESGSIYYYYNYKLEGYAISEEIKLRGIRITEIKNYFSDYFDRNILYALSDDALYKILPHYRKYCQESTIQRLPLK